MVRRSLVEHFASWSDPCLERTRKHRWDDFLVLAFCALICGATTFEESEEFDEARHDWLKTFLELPNGIAGLDANVFGETVMVVSRNGMSP